MTCCDGFDERVCLHYGLYSIFKYKKLPLIFLGANLTATVLSTHHVKHLSHCAVHCFNNKTTCVGFKYRRPSTNHLQNCEVLKAMDNCNYTTHRNESGNWQFYEAVRDKPVSVNFDRLV